MSDEIPHLDPIDFGTFFECVHGHAPFPWQRRLLAEVVAHGRWPSLLDLPTGVGKTAALDVALFHLALEASFPNRRAPLRIVFVVDRRTIVDQAHARALSLARALEAPTHPVLVAVKARLLSLSRDANPLSVVTLRGGMPRSDAWAKSPDRPVIALSTVDQVGSRLLFRGYGLSDAMRPIHAGLLGEDVLWLLDEVHLSEPFRETLEAIAHRYRGWAERPVGRPFAVVEMSATPSRPRPASTFGLSPEDRDHPVLAQRLTAAKPTSLILDLKDRSFTEGCVRAVTDQLGRGFKTLGVVLNRVHTARQVATALTRSLRNEASVHLVTGRMRPLDREDLERELVPRIGAGRTSLPEEKPIVVVATQCIEAGADFDFDALITECASLDALRQRFGRLNRLGQRDTAAGIILARSGDLRQDPVYGDAVHHTLAFLKSLPQIDFGLAALEIPSGEALHPLLAGSAHAPILLPAHLDAWVQTAPVPDPDPDVSLWLHGPHRGSPEVSLVWRADLSKDLLAPEYLRHMEALLEALPPTSPEALAVPLAAARRWLLGLPEPNVADVEGALEEDDEPKQQPTRDWVAAAWRGDRVELVNASALRAGDTLVVPTSYGGLAQRNWAPEASDEAALPILDRAEEATLRQRGRAVLRLHPAVLDDLPAGPTPSEALDARGEREALDAWLAGLAEVPPQLARVIAQLRREPARRRRILTLEAPSTDDNLSLSPYFVISGRHLGEADDVISTEQEAASFTGTEVTLPDHLEGVAAFARDFARRTGLPSHLVDDIALAGLWHDAGKADPRFQRLLHGGDAFRAAVAPSLIAKSATPPSDAQARARAQALSGYPRGARHEVLSVAMLEGAEALRGKAHDWDLVLHLVASHHGHCRPLAPFAFDLAPESVTFEHDGVRVSASSDHGLERLDSGVGARFWRLVRRYGWWGLAYLEAVLRLGDHRRSEHEQRGGNP